MRIAILGLAALVAGCGFSPITTHVEPRVDLAPSRIGQGRSVLLTVRDARTERSVGQRQQGLVRGARIELDAPLEAIVARSVADTLERQGFRVVGDEPADAALTIEVEDLSYRASGGVIGASATSRAALSITGSSGDRRYAQSYAVADEDRMTVASGEHYSGARLSAILSETLRRMLTDRALLAILAPPAS